MLDTLKCLFGRHVFSFTREYLDKYQGASDNAIRCWCKRPGAEHYVDMTVEHARKIAHRNPKIKIETEKELLAYCTEYLEPLGHVAGRPVFALHHVSQLSIEYPDSLRRLFRE